MTYDCEIVEMPVQETVTIHTTCPVEELPQFFGQAFGEIMQCLQEQNIQPCGPAFATYHNMDMQALDIEAGFAVPQAVMARNRIQPGQISAGKFGAVLHIGPYDQMAPAYEALTTFIQEQGLEPVGICYEQYFDGPETPPEQIRTRVLFPLKP